VFERAHNGTLYLDDVGDMPRESQSRMLRVLVEQRFRRVGGEQDVQVDVRVVTSTSRDLKIEIAEGRFREDLFHRLNVVPIRVPALSERREDIQNWSTISSTACRAPRGCRAGGMGDDAIAVLQVHPWPGNVRQLRNNVERLLILATGDLNDPISADMLPQEVDQRQLDRHLWAANASSPCRCARRARCSSVSIWPPRSCVSAAISRAPPPSSAWSARPCTGSSSRWASRRRAAARKTKKSGNDVRVAYVNGQYQPHGQATVHIEDRGFQFADGVYEVWAVFDGRLADFDGHMTRLAAA
jgi:DNA-binding NtrC family response regulator